METLYKMKLEFKTGGSVTAGNAWGNNDGAAASASDDIFAPQSIAIMRGLEVDLQDIAMVFTRH